MLCPEGSVVTNESVNKEDEIGHKNILPEGAASVELSSYKNPKTWKKSITNFFRQQLRSTKSNEGDGGSSGSKANLDDNGIIPEHKWQSLGKVFRRQSFVDSWSKPSGQKEERSPQSKKLAVRKVLSNYFGKAQKVVPGTDKSQAE